MNNYIDKYGRFHHKPVTEENPIPSNNGWIYTAYAKKVGIPVDIEKLSQCFDDCIEVGSDGLAHLNRSPGKPTPPISRDEILGLAYIFDGPTDSYENDWSFSPFPLPKFSLIKLVKQLWELRPSIVDVTEEETIYEDDKFKSYTAKFYKQLEWKHRNYFWQNNLDQLYRFAFSVPITDRHFILKCWDKFRWYRPDNLFYFVAAKIDSKLSGSAGIRFLKYDTSAVEMSKEFPSDHPINLVVK